MFGDTTFRSAIICPTTFCLTTFRPTISCPKNQLSNELSFFRVRTTAAGSNCSYHEWASMEGALSMELGSVIQGCYLTGRNVVGHWNLLALSPLYSMNLDTVQTVYKDTGTF